MEQLLTELEPLGSVVDEHVEPVPVRVIEQVQNLSKGLPTPGTSVEGENCAWIAPTEPARVMVLLPLCEFV